MRSVAQEETLKRVRLLGQISIQNRVIERKKGVLEGVLAAKSNSEIAVEMSLSVRTVKAYVRRLMDEYGVEPEFRFSSNGRVRLAYLFYKSKGM